MARKRFRSTQRNEPVTDRSFQEYLYQTAAPLTTRTELMRLVRGGEDTYLELKVKLSNPERIAQGIVALANTGGGTIVFGVNDQMHVEGIDHPEEVQDELVRICREDIIPPLIPFIDRVAFDNGRRIVALDVQGKRRPYRTRDGRFFIRVGDNKRETSPEELSALLDDARPLLYEDIPVTQSTINDIDEAHLWTFMRAFEGAAFEESTVKDYPTSEILERYLMLGVKSQDDIAPTVAGLLLFGKDESVTKLLPRTSIIATRFGGDNVKAPIIERVELQGNLATLYEAALRFVNRYCDLWDARPGRSTSEADNSPIVARANYHRAVICEGVANALIHRDLVVRDVTTRLHIFDRAVEVVNPRRSAGFAPQALKSIRFGVQQRLNPRTVAVFASPAYGLRLVSGGLPMLLRQARTFSNRLPEIVSFNDEFRLRIHGV
ncbi:MAG TPA: RNA-binding domain-containing protein [Pyrinomonadaceae bacterium]|nr:RNA-binding domain-containing protein [Pyrinomonadaceae bacterium]